MLETVNRFLMSKGSLGKDVILTLVAGGVLAAGGGIAGLIAYEEPQPTQITTREMAANVEISDPADLLSPEDEDRLRKDTARLDRPSTVSRIHFVVLNDGGPKVNDTLENFLRDFHPDQIANDVYADGMVILGADMEARQHFLVTGEDVADQLALRNGQRLAKSLDAMKPGLQNSNIPGALFASASYALDVNDAEAYFASQESEPTKPGEAAGMGALAGLVLGGTATSRRHQRRQIAEDIRGEYEALSAGYADLSQRLDELDIRAHSVSSAFANHELRTQWGQLRTQFLQMHNTVQGINPDSDRRLVNQQQHIKQAKTILDQTAQAEDNINRLFKAEQGDPAVRRSLITDIRSDVRRARRGVNQPGLQKDLSDLSDRIDWLDAHPSDSTFIDHFVRILGDYRDLMDDVRKQALPEVKQSEMERVPNLTDPVYTMVGVTSFTQMSSWSEKRRATDSLSQSETEENQAQGLLRRRSEISNHSHDSTPSWDSETEVDDTYSSGFRGSGGSSSF